MNELQRIDRHTLASPAPPAGSIDVTPVSIELPGPGLKRDYAGVLEYWQMIRRHKGAVVLATVLGCLAGFLATLSDPRIYQARTTLEIQGLNEEFLNMKNVNPVSETNGGYLDTDIQTQVKILQSRALLTRVSDKLDARSHPQNLQPADRLGMWRKALQINPPTPEQLWAEALGTAAGGVRVRSSGTNRIVDVTCDSTNGQLAADFCNILTQEYIDQNLEARWKATEYTGQWLTNQLRDLKIKLEKQQEELQAYARATGLVFMAEKNDVQEATLADLQKELSEARADRISKQSKYEMAATSPAAALPDVLDDLPLKDTQKGLPELQARLAELEVTYTANHSEVKRVRAQISAIERTLEASRTNILTRIRKEYEAAERREALLAKAYGDQTRLLSGKAEETAHYNLLKREVDATRQLYETLLQRLKEASIASALRATNVRVVDAAEPPEAPYKPNMTQRGTVGLLFGLVLGIVFAVLRERADRTLQDPGDVSYYLGVPELGVVPVGDLFDAARPKKALRSSSRSLRSDGSVPGEGFDSRVEMISFRQKTSLLAESFRTTLTSILFSRRSAAERPRLLVLTSASPKEGKTTVVCNLGISLAEIHHRVLIIDGDMRRPRIHNVFDVANTRGLSDLLLEKVSLNRATFEAACAPTVVPGLFVLPSGSSRHQASTLLHSPRLAELLQLARECFDTVVVDTPPMVNIADARVVARFGDALILIVRSGVTTRDAAQLAKARFTEDGTPVLGTILNFWNPRTPGYSYYKYYYAGYYHYYGDGRRKGGGNGNGRGHRDGDARSGIEPSAESAMSMPGFALRREPGDGDGRVGPEREM